jgi:hypothetical protein
MAGGEGLKISSETSSNTHTKRISPPSPRMVPVLRLCSRRFGARANFLVAKLDI